MKKKLRIKDLEAENESLRNEIKIMEFIIDDQDRRLHAAAHLSDPYNEKSRGMPNATLDATYDALGIIIRV